MRDADAGKTPAPDPEIPDELRAKVSRPHRPAGYTPKSEAAEEENVAVETKPAGPLRDLRKFWKQLGAVLKNPDKFVRVEMRERVVRQKGKPARLVKEPIKIPVEFTVGQDGLPYPSEAISAEETRRVRALNYQGAPAMDPGLGDLTPQFVEWLYLNHPYDAAVRYGAGRSTHVQADAVARVT